MAATLLMLWCLAGQCEEIQAPVSITMAECSIWGQIHARRWQLENPAYAEHTFGGWRCENGVRA